MPAAAPSSSPRDAAIKRLAGESLPAGDIAAKLQLSASYVRQRADALGLTLARSGSGWTEERVAILRKLWAEGLSASQIAEELGGCTRNAVIGKVNREGLAGRAKPAKPPTRSGGRPAHRPAARPKPTPPVFHTLPVDPPRPREESLAAMAALAATPRPAGRVSVLDLRETTCKWPLGDPKSDDFEFCGRRVCGAGPYCEGHAIGAVRQARPRRSSDPRDRAAAMREAARRRPDDDGSFLDQRWGGSGAGSAS